MQTDCHDAFPVTSLWKLVSYIYSYGLVQYINALSFVLFPWCNLFHAYLSDSRPSLPYRDIHPCH